MRYSNITEGRQAEIASTSSRSQRCKQEWVYQSIEQIECWEQQGRRKKVALVLSKVTVIKCQNDSTHSIWSTNRHRP